MLKNLLERAGVKKAGKYTDDMEVIFKASNDVRLTNYEISALKRLLETASLNMIFNSMGEKITKKVNLVDDVLDRFEDKIKDKDDGLGCLGDNDENKDNG
jgi:DNA-binding protein